MTNHPVASPSSRSARIDVLRGIAVFGILLVNVWSFVWGFESLRYGVLQPNASIFDVLSVAFVAFFAEQKFYPVFAFLFGAGFAIYANSLKRKLGRWSSVNLVYRHRLAWLLGCGIVHGMLIWFGDILTVYSLSGFLILSGMAGARLKTIRNRLVFWGIIFAVSVLVMLMLAMPMMSVSELADQGKAAVDSVLASHEIYTTGTFIDIALQRANDYMAITMQSLFILPHIGVLFLLGVLSVRLRWLTQPWRHVALWRRVRLFGLAIGIPFNLIWAALILAEAIDPLHPPAASYFASALLPVGGSSLAAAYVAMMMLASERTVNRLRPWFAPVGKMALTNYLGQSTSCAILLQGWSFGLGATLPPAGWIAIAFAIMAVQIFFSRWWLASHAQGPIEALYRRHTDRKIAAFAKTADGD
jgi:uncharacterized protein